MPDLPTGTVTFLFSDIEGSTRLLHRLGARYAAVLEAHRRLIREAFSAEGGREVDTAGDAFFVAFPKATQAVAAAVAAQRAMAAHPWPEGAPLRVRMGLHTGEPVVTAEGYVGLDVHRAARICSAAHGAQVLLSQAAFDLARHAFPDGVAARALGAHRLKDLQQPERLYQLVVPGLPADFPPLRTLTSRPNNLPAQPTSLVGREREVAALLDLLREETVRLVTLTGPGGTGKTRLSLQAAADLLDDFEAGVFFVPLAPITDPALVASTVAQALGVRENPALTILEALREHLGTRPVLLVLDNFEQVTAAAPVVADLLGACPGVKALVTSRVVLHLRGEHEFPVPPLALPDPQQPASGAALSQYAAVELFIQRAKAARPGFAIDDDNAPAVAEICYRLDGLPLAIELAAARIKLFSPRAMLARLEKPLDLLRGGARDLPDRHQTLRQAIAWSYDLLEEDEQVLFRRLAVFVGGCTLDAAEAVCAADGTLDALDGVAALVDKSLLRREDDPDGEPRFQMLETIREFGLQRLAAANEADALRRAHAAFFGDLAEQAAPFLTGPDQIAWLDRLEAEHDNLRAALRWVDAAGEVETGLRIGAALWRFWVVRGHMREGIQQLARLRAAGKAFAHTSLWVTVLNAAGTMAQQLGDIQAAIDLLEEVLAACRQRGDRRGTATSLNNLGWVVFQTGDNARASALSHEALAIMRDLGDKRGIATSLNNLAQIASYLSDFDEALARGAENLRLRREIGEQRGIAYTQAYLGYCHFQRGDFAQAASLLEEALAKIREVGDKQIHPFVLCVLGYMRYDQARTEEAEPFFEEALPLWKEAGSMFGLSYVSRGLALCALSRGEQAQAMRMLEESLAVYRQMGHAWGTATTLTYLGDAACDSGDYERAASSYREARARLEACCYRRDLAECLLGLGAVAVAEERLEEAADLFTEAEAVRRAIGIPLTPRQQVRYGALIAAAQASR